jgi:hypothetical protein
MVRGHATRAAREQSAPFARYPGTASGVEGGAAQIVVSRRQGRGLLATR